VAVVSFVARWKSSHSVASLKAAIDLIRRRGVANSAAAAVANLIKLVGIFFSFSRNSPVPGNQHFAME
jgi:hypothetical protein